MVLFGVEAQQQEGIPLDRLPQELRTQRTQAKDTCVFIKRVILWSELERPYVTQESLDFAALVPWPPELCECVCVCVSHCTLDT